VGTHPVVARFVHHVWMMDVTQIATFLAFSRAGRGLVGCPVADSRF
jgi:hypothetical protein